mmetsp:Transcript_18367/g.43511  ORF Transcript_18367/g.43511 Transcript_18367/m.43511 type:complete len:214 (+) Transcript_18367:104-745(+)
MRGQESERHQLGVYLRRACKGHGELRGVGEAGLRVLRGRVQRDAEGWDGSRRQGPRGAERGRLRGGGEGAQQVSAPEPGDPHGFRAPRLSAPLGLRDAGRGRRASQAPTELPRGCAVFLAATRGRGPGCGLRPVSPPPLLAESVSPGHQEPQHFAGQERHCQDGRFRFGMPVAHGGPPGGAGVWHGGLRLPPLRAPRGGYRGLRGVLLRHGAL